MVSETQLTTFYQYIFNFHFELVTVKELKRQRDTRPVLLTSEMTTAGCKTSATKRRAEMLSVNLREHSTKNF